MQSDAYPNLPIQSHRFNANSNSKSKIVGFSQPSDSQSGYAYHRVEYFLQEIENLLADCTPDEAEVFWADADRIKSRYRIASVMNEIENLLVTFASVNDEANTLKAIAEQVKAYGKSVEIEEFERTEIIEKSDSRWEEGRRKPEIPSFLIKRRDINRG
jgi:hypothetical protein